MAATVRAPGPSGSSPSLMQSIPTGSQRFPCLMLVLHHLEVKNLVRFVRCDSFGVFLKHSSFEYPSAQSACPACTACSTQCTVGDSHRITAGDSLVLKWEKGKIQRCQWFMALLRSRCANIRSFLKSQAWELFLKILSLSFYAFSFTDLSS